MGKNSAIEWTDHTFNPWWGCVKVSDGCKNCYAEARQYGGDFWGMDKERRFFGDKHWNDPLRWNKKAGEKGIREKVFCGSYCDILEHRKDLVDHQDRLVELIQKTPNLDWLLLTKRPENFWFIFERHASPDNIWLGVSVEDQKTADKRIPLLVNLPAKIKFLSVEPLLDQLELHGWLFECRCEDQREDPIQVCGERPTNYNINKTDGKWRYVDGLYQHWHDYPISHVTLDPDPQIDWVIVGGESGSLARPMHPNWVNYLQLQCEAAGVPFFFKQWGEWYPDNSQLSMGSKTYTMPRSLRQPAQVFHQLGKKDSGYLLDGKEYREFPGV